MVAVGIFDRIKGGKKDDDKKAELKENIRKIREKVQEQDEGRPGGPSPPQREEQQRGPPPEEGQGRRGPAPAPPQRWGDLQQEWEGEEDAGEGERFGEPEEQPPAPAPDERGPPRREQEPAAQRPDQPSPPRQPPQEQQREQRMGAPGQAETGPQQAPAEATPESQRQPQQDRRRVQRRQDAREALEEVAERSPRQQQKPAGDVELEAPEEESVEEAELPEPPVLEDIEIPEIEHEGPLFITVDKFQRALNMIGDMKRMTDDIEGQARSLQATLDQDTATEEDMQAVMDQFVERTESMKDLIMP